MIERTQVFVDTSYLLASFYNSWEEGARDQLQIDLAQVVAELNHIIRVAIPQAVQRQYWYDGIPESGPHRYQRSLRVIEGVQLRAGQLIEWGARRTQKAVDTRLVVDMVLAAVRGQCTDMVLVSGDADMLPGVHEAVLAGVRVHLIGFGLDSMSSALRFACDSTTILDPRVDFAECMKITALKGPIPTQIPVKQGAGTTVGTESDADTADAPELGYGQIEASEIEAVLDLVERPLADFDPNFPATDIASAGATVGAESVSPVRHRPAVVEEGKEPRPSMPMSGEVPDGTKGGLPNTSYTGSSGFDADDEGDGDADSEAPETLSSQRPSPSMMAMRRRPPRSKYVPLSEEVWTTSGEQTPYDVGQHYATWWYSQAASDEQRDGAHLLSGGALPPDIDRPLLQFACQTLHEFTLDEAQRVGLRDGFHAGIRAILFSR